LKSIFSAHETHEIDEKKEEIFLILSYFSFLYVCFVGKILSLNTVSQRLSVSALITAFPDILIESALGLTDKLNKKVAARALRVH
jgi:hypothetical protein